MHERPVRSILRGEPAEVVSAGPEESVRDAARRMAENRCGSVLVMEDQRMLGIFTERDLLVRVVVAGRDPGLTRVDEVMTASGVETIDADEPVGEAIRKMDEGSFRHLPVTDGSRIVGVLSIRDIPVVDLGRMAPELDERHSLAERIW